MAIAAERAGWITFGEAQRRLVCGRVALLNLVNGGRLSVRDVPGSRPRVRGDEVDNLVEQFTRRRDHAAT